MASSYSNWEQFYHRYNMIFNGLIAIPMLPFAYFFLETQQEIPEPPLVSESMVFILSISIVLVAALSITYSIMFKKSISEKVKAQTSIKEKLDTFLIEKTKQYIILEIAAIGVIVGIYFTKDQLFAVIYVMVLFIFSLIRPSFDGVVRETRIPEKELKNWGDQHS